MKIGNAVSSSLSLYLGDKSSDQTPALWGTSRDWHVDVIRGWAALAVVCLHVRMVMWIGMRDFWSTAHQHLSLSFLAGLATFPIVWGSAGVAIFFVISGYCIHIGWAHNTAINASYKMPVGIFLLRRITRIYPVLLAALILTFLCDSISNRLGANARLHDIGLHSFLINILSLQGIAGNPFGSNGALWTLSIEIQLYVAYPILLLMRQKIGMAATTLVILIINIVSALAFESHGILIFSSYWVSWMLGAWIAEARVHKFSSTKTTTFNAAAGVLGVIGCAVFFKNHFLSFHIWAIAFSAWFLVVKFPKNPATLLSKLMGKLGEFSYSLYIIHLPLIILILALFFKSRPQLSIWPTIGSIVLVIPIAYLFHLLIERPAIALTNRLKRRRNIDTARSSRVVGT
jgi:peptidoglycan/LPS O-acetylase OafA/YrhL